MTKEQIKALIAEKIAGQGNQVDSGGALAEILTSLADAMVDIPVVPYKEKTEITESEFQKFQSSTLIKNYLGTYYTLCSDAELVTDILTILDYADGMVFVNALAYDNAGAVSSYDAIVVTSDDGKYYVDFQTL